MLVGIRIDCLLEGILSVATKALPEIDGSNKDGYTNRGQNPAQN
jgi:hypothetical protein